MPKVTLDFDDVTIAFEELTTGVYKVVDREVKEFWDTVHSQNPVLSGDMKRSWTYSTPEIGTEWTWTAKNLMDYSDIITQGRRLVAGRLYGSLKLGEVKDPRGWANAGIVPLLEKTVNKIIRGVDELKI